MHIFQDLSDSEMRMEGTIGTTVDREATMRQKSLSQLKESVLNEVLNLGLFLSHCHYVCDMAILMVIIIYE